MKGAEISTVITQGRAYQSSSFLFKFITHKAENKAINKAINKAEKQNGKKRPAYISSKKIFKTAVLRNKARRRARAALCVVRKDHGVDFTAYNMIFILNTKVLTTPMSDLVEEIRSVFQKSAIIKAN